MVQRFGVGNAVGHSEELLGSRFFSKSWLPFTARQLPLERLEVLEGGESES